MADLTAARWRKYGKDRLYVSTGDGVRVGWVDLLTGDTVVEVPDLGQSFTVAVNDWAAEAGIVVPGQRVGTCDDALLPQPAAPQRPAAPPPAGVPTNASAHGDAAAAAARPVDDRGACGDEPDASPSQRGPSPVASVENQTPAQSEPVEQAATAEPAAPAWDDLSLNVPGQAARQQADAELAAQRERSRVGSFIARALDMKTDQRAWRVGAGGEETVGARLDKLTKRGWHILHAVPVGERGSDIDHVVIGHGGVYTLNTKTHPGGSVWVGRHQVRVNGHRTDYLRNSRHEGERAARLLTAAVGFPVPVMPALVFLTGTLIPNVTIKQQPDDVFVYDRTDIPGVFKRAPQRLTPEQVAAVFEQARRSTTWQPRT